LTATKLPVKCRKRIRRRQPGADFSQDRLRDCLTVTSKERSAPDRVASGQLKQIRRRLQACPHKIDPIADRPVER
jgi:hypothetical protein